LDGVAYGSLTVSYGSGEHQWCDPKLDLIISDPREWKPLGLRKETGFHLSPGYTKTFIWCEKYFVAPPYIVNDPVVIGRLTPALVARYRRCIAARTAGT
jgi:hypothetical protein